jgi:hypothetical protein
VEPSGRSEDGPSTQSQPTIRDKHWVAGPRRMVGQAGAVLRPVVLSHSLNVRLRGSDLYIQSNTWQPKTNNTYASTGWHTHPGHSLIIVTAGTITEYEDDGSNCTPHVYQKGDTLVGPGNGHVHMIRNESGVLASTMAVQLVPYDPAKANRRIDAPTPENCSSVN